MIVQLIEEEIRRKYPPTRNESREDILNTTYTLHCSQIFASTLYKSFLDMGFQIPVLLEDLEEATIEAVQNENVRYTKYQIPNIGCIIVYTDMEEGYRIEKITEKKMKWGTDEYKDYKIDKS